MSAILDHRPDVKCNSRRQDEHNNDTVENFIHTYIFICLRHNGP